MREGVASNQEQQENILYFKEEMHLQENVEKKG